MNLNVKVTEELLAAVKNYKLPSLTPKQLYNLKYRTKNKLKKNELSNT